MIRDGKKVMPSIFISGTIIKITVKFAYTYIMGTQFKKLRLFLHKVLLVITFFISSLAWDAVCRSRKILCCSVGAPNASCVSALRRPQNGVFKVRPSAGQKGGSRRVLNRDCREGEGEQSAPLLHFPPLFAERCTVWRCHAEGRLDSSSCSAEPT